MDTLRGTFDSSEPADRNTFDDRTDWDDAENEIGDETRDGLRDELDDDFGEEGEADRDLPPDSIGQDERRMQVRAYNHWAGLLGERTFPSIEDLEPSDLPDFGPHSVLLDFSAGIDDPVVQYLGGKLGEECGADGRVIERLSDVPSRSLLSRITDHYMQIMANQAPIGFEAEFVNQRGLAILYRGILLPYSSDDETIDFIYGVINWKEMADQVTADELLLEIDQALEHESAPVEAEPYTVNADMMTDWADSPAHEGGEEPAPDFGGEAANETADDGDNVADLGDAGGHSDGSEQDHDDLPMPDFGQYTLDGPYGDEDEEDDVDETKYSFASLADYIETPAKKAIDLEADNFDPADYRVEHDEPPVPEGYVPEAYVPEGSQPEGPADDPLSDAAPVKPEPGLTVDAEPEDEAPPVEPELETAALDDNADLHDYLTAARELAKSARASEDRSRHALYEAVGRAYDFSIAAKEAPQDYNNLVEQSGLTVQDRAPMTPVVKLVFGSDYDKTRLTEYAAVLSHAHRLELDRGSLAGFLREADGGLKGVVTAERRLRREESGKVVEPEDAVRSALAQKLRELEALTFDAISAEGPEFALVMVRRGSSSAVEVLGEIGEDIALIERAAKKLVG